jgi:hypothetical protein
VLVDLLRRRRWRAGNIARSRLSGGFRGADQAALGELIDGDEVFEELREMIVEPRLPRKRARRKRGADLTE